jgi:hypothetical protein
MGTVGLFSVVDFFNSRAIVRPFSSRYLIRSRASLWPQNSDRVAQLGKARSHRLTGGRP